MAKNQNLTQIACEIGIFSAIGFILDELQSILFKGLFINGGSIGFAMIVVLIIGYRRGFLSALLTGLIIGLFDLATGAFIIHPAQLLLDYLLPYALVSFGVLLRPLFLKSQTNKNLILVLSVIIGGMARFLSFYLSGIIFWANPNEFAWGLNNFSPYLYCFIYNFSFTGPSIVLSSLLLYFMNKKRESILVSNNLIFKENFEQSKEGKISKKYTIISLLAIVLGVTIFTLFFTQYIQSFYYSHESAIEYSFSTDCMLIFILGLFILCLGIISLLESIKKNFSIKFFSAGCILISLFSLICALTQLIKAIKKSTSINGYILWLITSFIILIIFCIIYKKLKNKK